MQTEFTSGPWCTGDPDPCWYADQATIVYAGNGERIEIADCNQRNEGRQTQEERRANAKLIARTPDLLAALDLIADVTQSNIPPSHRLETIQTLARTAIAQATQQEEAA